MNARVAAMAASLVPRFCRSSMMVSITSPGIRRISRNTTTVVSSRVGIMDQSRRMM